VFIAVEQRVLLLSRKTCPSEACASHSTTGRLVGLETSVGKDDDESLSVFVGRGDRSMLLGDELWQGGRGQRLRSCCCA
jgi:hypothetical protein